MAIIDGQIRCQRCKTLKALSDFSPCFVKIGRGKCRECCRIDARTKYKNNPEHYRAYARTWIQTHKKQVSDRKSKKYWENPEAHRARARQRRISGKTLASEMAEFGLTAAQYHEMLQQQGGRCAICNSNKSRGRLAVDHCHQTGAVRGLLCHRCNLAIGKLGDNAASLQKAADYIIGRDSTFGYSAGLL